jgi:hypothetical protein
MVSHWNSAGTSSSIQAEDQVYAKLSRAGVDDHDLPLTVSLTAQYTANVSADLDGHGEWSERSQRLSAHNATELRNQQSPDPGRQSE